MGFYVIVFGRGQTLCPQAEDNKELPSGETPRTYYKWTQEEQVRFKLYSCIVDGTQTKYN